MLVEFILLIDVLMLLIDVLMPLMDEVLLVIDVVCDARPLAGRDGLHGSTMFPYVNVH